MLNLNSVMLGTQNFEEMSKFYEKVFEKAPDMKDEKFVGWYTGSSFFSVGEHSQMVGNSKEPGRVIFNLETKEVKEDFERLKALGAGVVKEPYEMGEAWIATLSDPDGNFFQLMTPWSDDTKN